MSRSRPQVPFATRYARSGMVCSVDHLASDAGVALLRAGGSAADAAVAASAVLAVTTQHMCGMGGDLWALVHFADGEPPAALNASGRAGSGADASGLRSEGRTRMRFRADIRSVPIPGCVDGWLALHERFGRAPLAEVLAAAIDLAEGGFPLSPHGAAATTLLDGAANSGDYPAGSSPGDLIRRPGVAAALREIIEGGREAYYEGDFGSDLIELGRGEYAAADLARSQADWVPPLRTAAWDHAIFTVPPNSQGYLTLAGAWIADGLDLPSDPDDPLFAHLLAEAAKQAGWDRPEVLSDSADGNALISPGRLAPRRSAISPDVASPLGAGTSTGDTMYLAAVDADRMGVSLIQSNASGWGVGLWTPHTPDQPAQPRHRVQPRRGAPGRVQPWAPAAAHARTGARAARRQLVARGRRDDGRRCPAAGVAAGARARSRLRRRTGTRHRLRALALGRGCRNRLRHLGRAREPRAPHRRPCRVGNDRAGWPNWHSEATASAPMPRTTTPSGTRTSSKSTTACSPEPPIHGR